MNIQQRFEAIQAIKKYASIRSRLVDANGSFCAVGALMLVANIINLQGEYLIHPALNIYAQTAKYFGLGTNVISQLMGVNDRYDDPLLRRQKLIEYLESIPLTQ